MKIFKLFVCLTLILSISLINSFAAISVSDGSAFVTKAEFAADLNNLSNRMSYLENSLDAKIDSLVSSYLSRNGIWNGEKQEVNTPPTTQVGLKWKNTGGWGFVFNQTFSNPTGSGGKNVVMNNQNLWAHKSYVYEPDKTADLDAIIVPTTSKSGLANLIVNFSNVSYTFGTYLTLPSSSVHGDYWGSSFSQEYSVLTKGNLVYYDVFNFNMPTHATYKLNYKSKINCYFFVEKGNDITLKIVPTVDSGQAPIKRSVDQNMGCTVSSWSVNVY